MTNTVTIYRRRIPEIPVSGKPLGRHVHFDSRSALYPFRTNYPRTAIVARSWAREAPVLDQGDLGSCTGNAVVGCVGTSPLFETLPTAHVALDEAEAVKVYSLATSLDSYPGAYPPNDTGSDGIDACKAAQQLGLISNYTHCTDIATMELALQTGPVAIGINWYSSFDTPASDGLVSIARAAYIRGGHEVEVLGVDPANSMFYAVNSWGTSWGYNGTFHFSYADMTRLLAEEGDCTVPLPLTAPQPPTPPGPPNPPGPPTPPDPTDIDVQLWQNVEHWAQARHSGSNKVAAADVRAWAKVKGYYGA